MPEQRIDQRTATRTGGRVDGHILWLMNDDDMIILKQNIERDILRLWRIINGRRDVHGIFNISAHFRRRIRDNITIRSNLTCFNQHTQTRAG